MSEGYLVTLIALFGVMCTVISPMILAYLTARTNRQIRQEDWERQEQAAAEVATKAAAVATQAAQAARLLLVHNEVMAAGTEVTNDKLDQVHKIVNQQRTDMRRYQDVLRAALMNAGVPVPHDASLDPKE